MGSFTPSEWDPVYKNCCEGLQPGGWIKQLEENPRVHYDDGSVPDNKCAWVLEDEACKAADNWGRPITVADTMKSSLEKAGFVDVHAKTYKWPIGAWIKDPVLKEAGNLHYHQWASGMKGWSMLFLTKYGLLEPWRNEEVPILLPKMRAEIQNARHHVRGWNYI